MYVLLMLQPLVNDKNCQTKTGAKTEKSLSTSQLED